jgi:small subunit ribosomal protein S19
MSRSKWKGPFLNSQNRAISIKKNNLEKISRNSFIVPNQIGKTLETHNGKSYSEITISKEMLGHEFGEFVFTRKKFIFKKKKSKK